MGYSVSENWGESGEDTEKTEIQEIKWTPNLELYKEA